MREMASGQIQLTQDVVAHLRRLGHASSPGEVIKELQWLAPSLGAPLALSTQSLGALTALAEAHLRERLEPSHDPLTGLLDARAFTELWRAYARRAVGIGPSAVPVVVVLQLIGGHEVAPSAPQSAADLRTLAAICTQHVAGDDYIGRIAPAAIAVLPRNGSLRGAQSVRARLLAACSSELAGIGYALRVEVELRDESGAVYECGEELLGAIAAE
jgi:GGDEF domain-containing protein